MKIAIWGSYCHGNFGDDLMAVLFAQKLKMMGGHPTIYRMHNRLAARYGLRTVDKLSELLDGALFCIIGGGAFLFSNSYKRILFSSIDRKFEFQCLELSAELKKYNKKIFPISIGGDGISDSSKLSYFRRYLFKNEAFTDASVRLPSDVAICKSLGINAKYYPDVLLGVSKILGITRKKFDERIHIGVNLIKKGNKGLIERLINLSEKRSDIVLHFIKSHLAELQISYEFTPNKTNDRIKFYQYVDPIEMTKYLSSLDLIISSKLHLGVVALSFGVPFICFRGKAKTRTFLNTFKSREQITFIDKVQSLDEFLLQKELIYKIYNIYNADLVDEMAQSSLGHLIFLERITNNYIQYVTKPAS